MFCCKIAALSTRTSRKNTQLLSLYCLNNPLHRFNLIKASTCFFIAKNCDFFLATFFKERDSIKNCPVGLRFCKFLQVLKDDCFLLSYSIKYHDLFKLQRTFK